ncbi:MAG: SMP-30/gluconolactonase/LRE family protein [Marinobacter sp.]|nr:SMP-30/gluconolactonase/LRE family protein [Marinobacter sp.]
MKWLVAVLLILFIFVGGLVMAPSPVDSRAWQAPEPPVMSGVFAPNELLRQADLLALGQVYGPEDVAIDAEGRLYGGTQDGKVVRVWPDGRVEDWVVTGGRPLGMVFDAQGYLIVADAWKGLLAINPDGDIRVLATEADGIPFAFTDDLDIAPDGRIYFSDASSRFNQPEYMLDLLELRPHGRLLRYDPATEAVETLVSDLYFANGVAVSLAGDYVLVNETWKYRIQRYWLEGPRAGELEVFADNLPGFPDNLAVDEAGRYWVALPSPRNAQVDSLHRRPWLKNLVAKLPERFNPPVDAYGLVIALDSAGQPLVSLHDTSGEHLQEITSVTPHGGYLYFGSLHNDRIGRLPLSAIPGL